MLTDGGEIHEEIESEPCAAQESNNQIPQISYHIGVPSWSPSSGKEFSFSFIAQHKCGSIYSINCQIVLLTQRQCLFCKVSGTQFPCRRTPWSLSLQANF